MVTVIDGASHTLGFLGAAFGAPVVPLGMDRFGQSGTVPDLYVPNLVAKGEIGPTFFGHSYEQTQTPPPPFE